VNGLAGFLPDAAEGDEGRLRHDAGFLFEFTARGVEQLLARRYHALWNRPGSIVSVRPEWTARMRQKNFERTVPPAVEQEAGAYCLP
jgi:hypothetical protein